MNEEIHLKLEQLAQDIFEKSCGKLTKEEAWKLAEETLNENISFGPKISDYEKLIGREHN